MIYDCFTFFNELDLLEIRLNILNEVVDKFVLVEATKTHSNLDKPLYFRDNQERFKKFADKIIHIVVTEYPAFENSWTYEQYQRNCISQGLKDCAPSDIILISDLDEIPNPKKIMAYKDCPGIKAFKQKMFYYFLNNLDMQNPYWVNTPTKMLSYSYLTEKGLSPQKIRFEKALLINNGGWHFSYLGGAEKILEKIKSFAHQEYNLEEFANLEKIADRVKRGEDVYGRGQGKRYGALKINLSFPKYIQDNQAKYQKLITSPNLNFRDKLVLGKNLFWRNLVIFIKKWKKN